VSAQQLELDTERRLQHLLSPHDLPELTPAEIASDPLAACMVRQAFLGAPATHTRRLAALEVELFLARTADDSTAHVLALLGSDAQLVPMQQPADASMFLHLQAAMPGRIRTDDSGRPEAGWWRHFVETDFENAIVLLADRRLLLRAGVAYLHADDLACILRKLYLDRLRRCMAQMHRQLCVDRTHPQFAHIAYISARVLARLTAPSDTRSAGPEDLCIDAVHDTMLRRAPLCVRALLLKLKTSDGLKNEERCVLRIFLQTCGVQLQVTLELFQRFSGLEEKAFVNKYGRDIHGSYKKQLHCYGCAKILKMGLCPFQHKHRALQVLAVAADNDAPADIEDCFKPPPRATTCPPSRACTAFYVKRHGPPPNDTPDFTYTNPRSYFLDAATGAQPKPVPTLFPCKERAARVELVRAGKLPR